MKKYFATLLFTLILISSNLECVFAASKALVYKSQATASLANKYIEAYVADNGRFTIGTVEGDPARTSDNGKKLLYGHPNPSTSETMVRVDSEYFTFGEGGIINTAPTQSGDTLVFSWEIKKIRITQTLSIVKSKGTRSKDTIEIKYSLTNMDVNTHTVAIRVQLDTLLGDNDGAPFRVPGSGEITTDHEYDNDPASASPDIPQYCHVFDNLSNPTVFSMITLRDIGYRTPDRLVLGYWPTSVGNWDYTIDVNRSFLDNDLNGMITGSSPDSDSSVIVWWGYPGTAISLNPGQTIQAAMLYGLSSLSFYTGSPFNIGLTSPGELEVTTEVTTFQYLPAPFIITAYLENVTFNAVNNATITLNLPPEFYLASGEQATKYIEEIPDSKVVAARKSAQVSWRVNTYGRYIGDRTFSATVNTGSGSKTAVRSIYVPGIQSCVFGQVTDNSNIPISGATVELLKAGSVLDTTNTQADGTYIFRALVFGNYEIRSTANGYASNTLPAVVTMESPSSCLIMLTLSILEFEAFAYPNPVKEGEVRIRWYSSQDKDIVIKIFNPAGNLIKTVKETSQNGTWKEILWNIDDVANGVYFYQIEITGQSKRITGKIVVLKKKQMK